MVGDDPQNKSSALPSASELTLADLELPVVYPGSVAEVIALGRYAYELSRYCGAWSALKIVTEVADAYQTVPAVDERHFVRPEFTWRDAPWKATQHITLQPVHTDPLEIEIRTGRIEAARRFADVNEIDRIVVDPPDASLLLVTPGRVYYELRDALSRLGITEHDLAGKGVRVYQPAQVWPLAPERLAARVARCHDGGRDRGEAGIPRDADQGSAVPPRRSS